MDVALALVAGIVDRNQPLHEVPSSPGPCDKTLGSPIAVPGRSAFEQAPFAVSNCRVPKHFEEGVVEATQCFVHALERRTDQMRRNTLRSALELPLMEESQAGRKKAYDGRGLVHAWRKGRGYPRLLLVLQEPRELALVVEPGMEVLAHGSRVPLAQAIVEPFVIGVVETLLQHRPLKVPVDLGHKAEMRNL